jgi:hypothetical protein
MPGKNMSLLTILEASKQFKVGRTSIYKAIKRGDITPRLNAQNIQVIDAQDMVRVFGGSVPKSVSETVHLLFLGTTRNWYVNCENRYKI